MFCNMRIAAVVLLTLTGFLSQPAHSRAANQGQVQGYEGWTATVSTGWSYYAFYPTYNQALRAAKSLQRQGYITKIKYDRRADVYEVWYQ